MYHGTPDQTRPDITQTVNKLSRRTCSPTQRDIEDAEKCLSYLQTTADKSFVVKGKGRLQITVYSHADGAGDKADRKSTTGTAVYLVNR